ncbi:NAD-dependent epimerase/dehydratase family protein [bacterium]|nr:MAG: NAD-dependent epimerase/dehydratase family protein [bacterium]
MKIATIAITGGTGFVGRHLARALVEAGHQVVLLSRGNDTRDLSVRSLDGVQFRQVGLDSVDELATAIEGCDAIAHCAGINREIGEQTYERVHVQGTRNVVEAAKRAGIPKIALLSFIRARPNCGSAYHESKWQAEQIVRSSGLDYTVLKEGMTYGVGDHMLDHLSHTIHSMPLFATVGLSEKAIRPVAIEDVVRILIACLTEGRLKNQTVPVLGPQRMRLSDAVFKVARLSHRPVLVFPFPVIGHKILASIFERLMPIPLISSAQVFMLSENMEQALPKGSTTPLPDDLKPRQRFTDAQVSQHLPTPKSFGLHDFGIKLSPPSH